MQIDLSPDEIERYARHILLAEIGGQGQMRLKSARVLVVGAGGLGSPLLLYLAAAGVGSIGVVDDDRVELSNLQRQVAHTTENIGQFKVDSIAAAATAINPAVQIERWRVRLTEENARRLIGDYDIVCDGTDNFSARFLIADACLSARRTLVSAAVLKFEGQLAVYKPHAGLELPCFRCLYPSPPPLEDAASCAETGILGTVTGVMGTLQANEVCKEILGIGESLAGRLLIWDALGCRFRMIRVPRDPACPTCGERQQPANG